MKKLTVKALNAIGIHNPHNLATAAGIKPVVYVGYSPQETGRASRSAKWFVKGIGFDTNPTAHWTDHGCKVFIPHHPINKANKDAARNEALVWASAQYGIREWERSPLGSYHPKGTMAALKLAEGETGC